MVILKVDCSSSVSLQKRHKADNTVNKKKTTGIVRALVNLHQLSGQFSMSVLVSICLGFVFLSWLNEWLLSDSHYSADHSAPHKSLVPMNTV